MAKISQASSKYIIRAKIDIEGVVDRPDVVGAIFGQIEGLLGADLELRELQRSGRIGRIEVEVNSKDGKTTGTIMIPSSLDKAETAIVGGALEIIERIGPCSAKIQVTDIEDERANKRQQVISRAKQLLKRLQDSQMPDSQELSDEVATGVRLEDITIYGKDKLPATPGIEQASDIVVVEGRADVINLIRHGFKGVISKDGTGVPQTIKDLCKKKTVTLLCDGDRGGDLIIEEMLETCDIDFITKAPDGKEVEELQKKEIHQALRHRVAAKDYKKKGRSRRSKGRNNRKSDRKSDNKSSSRKKSDKSRRGKDRSKKDSSSQNKGARKPRLSDEQKKEYVKVSKKLRGKSKAYVLNDDNQLLGKLDVKDIPGTLHSLPEARVLITKADLESDALRAIENANIKHLVAGGAKDKSNVYVLTRDDLEN